MSDDYDKLKAQADAIKKRDADRVHKAAVSEILSLATRYAQQPSGIWRTYVPHSLGDFMELREFRRALEEALAAPSQPEGAEPVGEAELMPKTAGVFTRAMFDANEVPPGTPLYLHPSQPAAAPDQGSRWQPIATAPKNESWILLAAFDESEPWVCAAFWSIDSEGWFSGEADSHSADEFVTPSHWMPFPSAPKG